MPPADGWIRLAQLTAEARRASEELRAEGVRVRFLRSIFVPEDDSCFYLYEATSVDDVHLAARRAELPFTQVEEAIGEAGAR